MFARKESFRRARRRRRISQRKNKLTGNGGTRGGKVKNQGTRLTVRQSEAKGVITRTAGRRNQRQVRRGSQAARFWRQPPHRSKYYYNRYLRSDRQPCWTFRHPHKPEHLSVNTMRSGTLQQQSRRITTQQPHTPERHRKRVRYPNRSRPRHGPIN